MIDGTIGGHGTTGRIGRRVAQVRPMGQRKYVGRGDRWERETCGKWREMEGMAKMEVRRDKLGFSGGLT